MLVFAVALLPALFLMLYIFKKDRIEKEPKGLLLKLLLFGALFSFIPALLEQLGDKLLSGFYRAGSTRYYLLEAFVVVGLSEEGFKRFILKRKTWNNHNFNCSFDGIVYAAYVSLGFALLENLLYVFGYGGAQSLATGLVRAVTAVPAHFFNSVFMGLYYGRAKACQLSGNMALMRRNLRLSLWVPVLLHGFYDACAFINTGLTNALFYVFLAAMYIFSFKVVRRESAADRYLTGTMEF